MSDVISEITAERKRQVEQEGWTPDHDDQHSHGALAAGAAFYALQGAAYSASEPWARDYRDYADFVWPFDIEWKKPKNARRDLIRAAAMIVAEIERLDRA